MKYIYTYATKAYFMRKTLFYVGVSVLLVAACGTPHLQMQANDSDGSDDSQTISSGLSLAPSSHSDAGSSFDFDCFVQLLGADADDPGDARILNHLKKMIDEAPSDALKHSYGPLSNELRYTPLMYLAEVGHNTLIAHLLEKIGVDQLLVYGDEDYQDTPLHHAVALNCTDTVKLLIDRISQYSGYERALKNILEAKDGEEMTIIDDARGRIKDILTDTQNTLNRKRSRSPGDNAASDDRPSSSPKVLKDGPGSNQPNS